ncbi:MAG: hypothetical protein AAF368_03965 [Planctomycetota bacterium]
MPEQDPNAEQAAALAQALAPLVAEALKPSLDERFEAAGTAVNERLDGIADANSKLLGRLHKAKDEKTSLEAMMANLQKHLDGHGAPQEIVLAKADARDPAKYRAAKAEAEKAGVALRIDRE